MDARAIRRVGRGEEMGRAVTTEDFYDLCACGHNLLAHSQGGPRQCDKVECGCSSFAVRSPHLPPLAAIDTINPAHYKQHPSGVEVIQITEHMNFCLGNAVKYILRAGLKTPDAVTDLRKAAWYVAREIDRLEKKAK